MSSRRQTTDMFGKTTGSTDAQRRAAIFQLCSFDKTGSDNPEVVGFKPVMHKNQLVWKGSHATPICEDCQ